MKGSLALILFLGLAALACVIPGLGSSSPAITPTALGDTISFTIPAYTYNLEPGDTVPGTRLQYIQRKGDAYEVSIDGLAATKRIGDSFIWNGVVAPGVHASYNLRLITAVLGPLPVAGPVNITVFNPDPFEQAFPSVSNALYTYNNILVNYSVPIGWPVPGTTMVYDGVTAQGEGNQTSRLARMSGVTGYPFLAIGDSLNWSGRLRDNVRIRYILRVAAFNENDLRVAGTAELWVVSSE